MKKNYKDIFVVVSIKSILYTGDKAFEINYSDIFNMIIT